jgi:hypothetical protein
MKILTIYITFITLSFLGFNQALAQSGIAGPLGMYVFPAQGQDQATQDADEYACYKWAVEQSGIDPINPPEVQADPNAGSGAVIGTAARGAAAGAAIGAITGSAGKGAAIGATAGAFGGARRRGYAKAGAEQQAAQQEAAMINSFKKAFAACLEGKGYTVK